MIIRRTVSSNLKELARPILMPKGDKDADWLRNLDLWPSHPTAAMKIKSRLRRIAARLEKK